MHPHTIELMETNTNTPEAKQPASAGCHPTTCSPSLLTPRTDLAIEDMTREGWDDLSELCRDLEIKLRSALGALAASRTNASLIQSLLYGSDGDCGAVRLASQIEDWCNEGLFPENAK